MIRINIDKMIFSDTEKQLTKENLEQLNIIEYFDSINRENFEKTAALFVDKGELLAPFEEPIVGRNQIASYLSQEARGMKLVPQEGIITENSSQEQKINIRGKVQTSLFSVNVGWDFTLNQKQEILSVRIKLLASPQELLGLKKLKK